MALCVSQPEARGIKITNVLPSRICWAVNLMLLNLAPLGTIRKGITYLVRVKLIYHLIMSVINQITCYLYNMRHSHGTVR